VVRADVADRVRWRNAADVTLRIERDNRSGNFLVVKGGDSSNFVTGITPW
jgi:hypothetical protein